MIRPATTLQRLRESAGLSQAEVAESLGTLSRAHLSRVERGERGLAEHAARLAELYGVSEIAIQRAWRKS